MKNFTLGIGRGECFGLLGMNGASKVNNLIPISTTLAALSGDVVPAQGEIWLNGYNLNAEYVLNSISDILFLILLVML